MPKTQVYKGKFTIKILTRSSGKETSIRGGLGKEEKLSRENWSALRHWMLLAALEVEVRRPVRESS